MQNLNLFLRSHQEEVLLLEHVADEFRNDLLFLGNDLLALLDVLADKPELVFENGQRVNHLPFKHQRQNALVFFRLLLQVVLNLFVEAVQRLAHFEEGLREVLNVLNLGVGVAFEVLEVGHHLIIVAQQVLLCHRHRIGEESRHNRAVVGGDKRLVLKREIRLVCIERLLVLLLVIGLCIP